jgi:hypothetical protein
MKLEPYHFLFLALNCFSLLSSAQTPDSLKYRPYPVLLVHGFNTFVAGTWGIHTDKEEKEYTGNDERKPKHMLSTKINPDLSESFKYLKTPLLDNDIVNDFGKDIVKLFDKNGNLSDRGMGDYTEYWDRFHPQEVDRLSPYEEKSQEDDFASYTDINHSFIEVYCPYYFNESNDADGNRFAEFWANGWKYVGDGPFTGNAYNLTLQTEGNNNCDVNVENYGGQTQLVRIGAGIGDWDSPVMKDLAKRSDFNTYIRGDGIAPMYHYKPEYIPYVNIKSKAHWAHGIIAPASVLATHLGNKKMLGISIFWPFPQIDEAIPWYNLANQLKLLHVWAGTSDLIVPFKSQDIQSIYPDNNRTAKQHHGAFVWHTNIVHDARSEVIRQLVDRSEFEITHAIGVNQTSSTKNNYTLIPRTPTAEYNGTNYSYQQQPMAYKTQ